MKKSELEKLLIEFDAIGELYFGMIEYFENCYNRDKEVNTLVVLQSFWFIWKSYNELSNKYYPLLLKLIDDRDEDDENKEETN